MTKGFYNVPVPQNEPVKILMTSGASCPDVLVEGVIEKLVSFYPVLHTTDKILKEFI